MDVNDLHGVREGAAPRRQRVFNPYVHLDVHSPLMQLLFSITRPTTGAGATPANKRLARKKAVRATAFPAGSMVAYAKERYDKPKR